MRQPLLTGYPLRQPFDGIERESASQRIVVNQRVEPFVGQIEELVGVNELTQGDVLFTDQVAVEERQRKISTIQ